MPSVRHTFRSMFALVLISLVWLGSGSAAAAQPIATAPEIAVESTGLASPGFVTVSGDGFTPDSMVYVTVLALRGDAVYGPNGSADPARGYVPGTVTLESQWVSASAAVYGPNGSADPAVGYHPGGVISERFAVACGADLMVRALDSQTATWSNWLDLDSGC